MDAPREDLVRFVPLSDAQTEARAAEDGNTLVGYAAVFNEWTEINSWEGRFRERIDPKAFDKTLKERGDKIKVLFNHGFDPQIGDKPLGKPRVMKPDQRGLWTETPLDDTSYNNDIKASLGSGALDGMSFRFSVTREEWNDDEDLDMPERIIKELRLYEFGPVTFPAYEATTAGVRARPAYEAWRQTHEQAPPTEYPLEPSDAGEATSEHHDAPPQEAPVDVRALARKNALRLRSYLIKESA